MDSKWIYGSKILREIWCIGLLEEASHRRIAGFFAKAQELCLERFPCCNHVLKIRSKHILRGLLFSSSAWKASAALDRKNTPHLVIIVALFSLQGPRQADNIIRSTGALNAPSEGGYPPAINS